MLIVCIIGYIAYKEFKNNNQQSLSISSTDMQNQVKLADTKPLDSIQTTYNLDSLNNVLYEIPEYDYVCFPYKTYRHCTLDGCNESQNFPSFFFVNLNTHVINTCGTSSCFNYMYNFNFIANDLTMSHEDDLAGTKLNMTIRGDKTFNYSLETARQRTYLKGVCYKHVNL